MLPLVYIIVLNWNGKSDTVECLHALRNITYTNYKIIVVDNASTDGSVEAIRAEFSDAEIIVNNENLRYAGGNNVGIKYALQNGADYVLLLNNDTIVEKKFLAELVQRAENDKRVGIAGSKIYYYGDKNRLWYAGGIIEWKKGWISHRGIRELDTQQYNMDSETDYITGCCMLVRRNVIEQIGILDEAYFIYGEDADWCMRVKNANFRLMYIPSSVVWHKVSVSSGGNFSWFKNWNKLKSNIRFFWRYAKWHHLFIIPFFMAINVIFSFQKAKKETKAIS
ncbi:MAG: glycosyltransferase family 2 protein [Bacteroidota bacterium]